MIIAAFSARALAQTARQCGHDVYAIDAFADRDLRSEVVDHRRWSPTPGHLARTIAGWNVPRQAPLLYGSGVDPMTGDLARIGRHRPILGNDVATLRRLNDPQRFFQGMERCGLATPPVRFTPPRGSTTAWLQKHPGRAGGQGIRFVTAESRRSSTRPYYQRWIDGVSGSLLFLADGRRGRPILLSTSWHDPAPGMPMRLGGICDRGVDPRSDPYWCRVVDALSDVFGLRGWNSLDFIETPGGRRYFLEINPRIGASFHLLSKNERRRAIAAHIQGSGAQIDSFALNHRRRRRAHAIVYAAAPIRVGAMDWPRWAGDIPIPGHRIGAGTPLCSVEAQADTPEGARRRVLARQYSLLSRLYGANPSGGDHHDPPAPFPPAAVRMARYR